MTHPRRFSSVAATIAALSLLVTAVPTTAQAVPVAATKTYARHDHTSALEARRIDRVPIPQIEWFKPSLDAGRLRLATVRLPRDYDDPTGPTVEIAVAKLPARNQKKKIGTLFVNPGGPGSSGADMAASAPYFASESMLDRFDIVGFDPRGGNASTNIRCFTSVRDQSRAMRSLALIPWNAKNRKKYLAASRATAEGCSSTARKTASAVSTAEVARDMEMLRRAVGDGKLNYLGFSYGTYLGEVYANMYPDRFRAMVLDGVINPKAWRGSAETGSTPMSLRLKSGEADWKILKRAFALCKQAGPDYCTLKDPAATFTSVVRKLRAKSYRYDGEVFDYGYLILDLLSVLYYQWGGAETAIDVVNIYDQITTQPSRAAVRQLHTLREKVRNAPYDFAYDASWENYLGVVCTDAVQPRKPSRWHKTISRATRTTAPHFATIWGWQDAACATSTWTAQDEDRYTGSFDKKTEHPVLIVGNYYDPATSYRSAQKAHDTMPHSYLLSSNSWGHTAFGTSSCINDGIDEYLLHGTKPPNYCESEYVPFSYPLDSESRSTATRTARMSVAASSALPKALPEPR